MRLSIWKSDCASPPPSRAMLIVIKFKFCWTVGLSTFNIACRGEGEQQHDVMSWKCLFHKFICKSQYILWGIVGCLDYFKTNWSGTTFLMQYFIISKNTPVKMRNMRVLINASYCVLNGDDGSYLQQEYLHLVGKWRHIDKYLRSRVFSIRSLLMKTLGLECRNVGS